MKNLTSLKVTTLNKPKALPRVIKETELKALVGGRMAESSGGTCSTGGDCDE